MHIRITSEEVHYADSLVDFPELREFAELVEKYFPINEVFVSTNYKSLEGVSATFKFLYKTIDGHDIKLRGIRLECNTYNNERHYTASPIFPDYFPFVQYFDHESTGGNLETVFYSLVNGIHDEIRDICSHIIEWNEEMVKKFTPKQKKITSEFHANEYC